MPSLSNNNLALRLYHLEKRHHDEIFGYRYRFISGLNLEIYKDSPAERAGLKEGECIIEINGFRCSTFENWDQINSVTKGKEVKVLIVNPK